MEDKKKNPPTEVLDDDFDDEEEVEDEEEEKDETDLDDEDLDDVDTDEDDADESEDEEDDEDKEKDKEKSKKKVQSKEERAYHAKKRREREAKEREAREKEIEQKAYLKGKLDSTTVNTYTEEPIKDEYDLFIFETQKQLEAEGKDPITDLPKRLAEINRNKAKEESEKANKQKQLDEQIDKEFAEFSGKYPSIKIPELLKDPDFAEYADGRLGKGGKTLTQLYESFLKFKTKLSGKSGEEEDNGQKPSPSPNGGRKRQKTSYSEMSEEQKIKELRRQGLIN